MTGDLGSELKEIVGDDWVLTSPVDRAVYECDGETLDVARPDLVVLPGSVSEVQAVVKLANRYKVPVVPRGAGTGLSGGATAIHGGISLVLTRLTGVLKIDPDELTAVVESGATNLSVSRASERFGLYFAPDPSSQAVSTIGGNLAENAGGPHTLKYGTTVNHVLSAKVILPDGTITTFGGAGRDCLGLDLLGVFVGSEGTLGIAVEAALRLTPMPQAVDTMVAYFPSVGLGGEAVSHIVANGVIPAAMEMIDQLTIKAVDDALKLGLNREAGCLLIVELDGPRAGIDAHRDIVIDCVKASGALSITWAADSRERARIWQARKSAFGSLGRIAPHGYVLDGVIPRSRLTEAISRIAEIGDRYQLVIANIYHAGDGNLHPCLLFHRDNLEQVKQVMLAAHEILTMCLTLGGTLSGEHGIGIEKMKETQIAFSKAEIEAMGWVHEAFNPDGLLNPGKAVPCTKICGESGLRPLLRHRLSERV